jgi:transposase-like protein
MDCVHYWEVGPWGGGGGANIVCDFEIGLMTALETELPRSRICACYFHYTQALWRKVANLGLVAQYRGSTAR